jgi:diguanylate cyclase (GGDEF)-like protein
MAEASRAGRDDDVQDVVELRTQLGRSLQSRAEAIVRDTISVCLFAGMERIASEDRAKLVALVFQLMAGAVHDGALDSRTSGVAELGQLLTDKGIDARMVFNVVYLTERTALDEVAADDLFGATSQSWPVVAQMVRRASFDVCGAFTEYIAREMAPAAIVDPLTTLHTRPVFVAALEKEIQRAERFGHPFAMILFDVDNLAEINATHGYGSGDRILERIGITIRNYFRETDWVARTSGDAFAVLLPEIQRVNAERLADRVRNVVRERLQLHDHRSDKQIAVTVSAGVLIAESVDKSVRAEQMMVEAKEAVDRAKQAGRNRIQSADVVIGRSVAPTRAGISMD